MKPHILAVGTLPVFLVERLQDAFTYHQIPHEPAGPDLLALAGQVRGIAATGESVVTRALLDQFPAVEIISVFGVGYDGIDVTAAHEKGITVTHTPGVLTEDVADMAIGLLLSVVRGIPEADRFVRTGGWQKGPFHFTRKLGGSRLGIIGLGRIGRAIAKRAEVFGLEIAYTDRQPIADVDYAFHATPAELAGAVDFLVVAAPGGAATAKLVNAEVLAALGPQGYLINIARGTLVDEQALVEALATGRIAGAALDVTADEPNVPAPLLKMENVVLTPHMASGTHETRHAMADLAFTNLERHFAGQPVVTPVPR